MQGAVQDWAWLTGRFWDVLDHRIGHSLEWSVPSGRFRWRTFTDPYEFGQDGYQTLWFLILFMKIDISTYLDITWSGQCPWGDSGVGTFTEPYEFGQDGFQTSCFFYTGHENCHFEWIGHNLKWPVPSRKKHVLKMRPFRACLDCFRFSYATKQNDGFARPAPIYCHFWCEKINK